MTNIFRLTLGVCLFGGLATISQAAFVVGDVINIDLQPPEDADGGGKIVFAVGNDGPLSQAGTATWNNFGDWSGVTAGQLLDAGGADSGLTLDVTANGGWYSNTYSSATPNSAVSDYMQWQGDGPDVLPFTISAVPAGSYELYVMTGVSQFSVGKTMTVSITGESDQNNIWDGGLPSDSGWVSGANYVKFDLTLDNPGSISGSITGTDTDVAVLNGLQLVSIPEPSSAALLGLGALALAMRRRK